MENQNNDSSFYAILGERIRIARVARGFDQDALAARIQLSRASIANIEKGRQRPPIYLLWLMAHVLNINVADLIPPIDIGTQVDDWTMRIENNISLLDDNQKKKLMDFISVTRNNK